MRDVFETAAFCAGCAAFAALVLGAVGFVATHVLAPAFGLGADHHAAIASVIARLFG